MRLIFLYVFFTFYPLLFWCWRVMLSRQNLESFAGRNTSFFMSMASCSSLQDPLRIIWIYLLMHFCTFLFLHWPAVPLTDDFFFLFFFMMTSMYVRYHLFFLFVIPKARFILLQDCISLIGHGWVVYVCEVSVPVSNLSHSMPGHPCDMSFVLRSWSEWLYLTSVSLHCLRVLETKVSHAIQNNCF